MKKPWHKKVKAILLVGVFALLNFSLFSQQITLSGTIISTDDRTPVPGANVQIKGTTTGTTTNDVGKYEIAVNVGDTIIFSSLGYLTSELNVESGMTTFDVSLSPDLIGVDEVVVIGYGIQKKTSVTGSLSTLSAKEVNQLPVASIESALQGQVAGVSVVNNGTPGTEPIVRIRGNGSISYEATPLYVVDGFPTTEIRNLNPRDIESMEILKDASATAIYGSRGANGVILITTKKGKMDGKTHVSFNSYIGVQMLPKKLDLLTNAEYLEYVSLMDDATPDFDVPARLSDSTFNSPIYEGTTQTYAQTETDWQSELFRKAMITQSDLSFSLNNDKSRYFGSVGYFKQDGIMVGTGFERLNFRLNSEHNLYKFLKFGQTLTYSSADRENEKRSQGRSNVMHMIRSLPYMPVEDPTKQGGYVAPDNSDGSDPDNPVKVQKLYRSNTLTSKLMGTMYLDVAITDFLTFRSTIGLDKATIINKSGEPIHNDGFFSLGSAATRKQQFDNTTKLFTNQLTFDKQWENHSLNVIAVAEQQSLKSEEMYISGQLPTNLVIDLTGLSNITAYGRTEENLLLSYLGRINYAFRNRYLVSIAARADGSSKLATDNKWGFFPSGSIGWRISEESFLKDLEAISDLKIRGGYGTVGNNSIGNYDWQSLMLTNTQYVLYNKTVDAAYLNAIPNPDLKWEISKTTNIGIDLAMFNNKFTFTADYFNKLTENLILAVPYPPSMGYTKEYYANVGEMKNYGVDVEAGYWIIKGDLKSRISANISVIRNEVLSLTTPTATIDAGQHPDFGGGDITRTVKGEPIQSFYGWQVDGIFQSDAQITQYNGIDGDDATPYQSNASPGDIRFKDISGPDGTPDGVVDSYDRTFLGSYLPKFSYGFNYTGSYKNFDFTVFFQGVYGNKIYNGTRVISEGMVRLFNSDAEVLDSWTHEGQDTEIPRAVSGDPNGNTRTSDRFIESGSYFRLKSLTIGYNLPKNILNTIVKDNPASLRIYVSAENLLTLTKYKGYDPEVGAQIPFTNGIYDYNSPNYGLTEGIDKGFCPSPKVIMGGIEINF